jgi:Tfp pilus assembly protein PilW
VKAGARGFSLVEALVGLTIFSLAMASVAGLLVHNSRLNKAQQMTADLQANARICMAMITAKLRTAGWDPLDTGFSPITPDPDLGDNISEMELFADLAEDGDLDDSGEAVLIRHVGNRIEWRTTAGDPFSVLAVNISNDADGDGTPEPMLIPDSTTDPRSVFVQITAESPVADPTSGLPIRYTVTSEVALRSRL